MSTLVTMCLYKRKKQKKQKKNRLLVQRTETDLKKDPPFPTPTKIYFTVYTVL